MAPDTICGNVQPLRPPLLLACACLATVVAGCGGSSTTAPAPATAATAATSVGQSSTPAGSATPTAGDSSSAAPTVPVAGTPPVNGTPWYLAIGDSITFGYTVDRARAGVNSAWALQLEGMLAQRGEPWKLYDTACPSERTDTYYTRCPSKQLVPFLADQSQHDAAMAAIAGHRADLKLILVDLGSNDLLAALRNGQDTATAATQLHASLTRILDELQRAAPGVLVVVCNYYNPLANLAPATQPQLALVNQLLSAVGADHHARLADFFGAINTTATGQDPQLCGYIDCAHTDVHPTVAGHTRLAQAALAVIP